MKQLLSLAAAAAIGLGGLTGCSMFHHNDQTAQAKSPSQNNVIGSGGDTSYSEGGTARIEDHRNDAGKQAQPASEKQSPATNDDNNNDFSD